MSLNELEYEFTPNSEVKDVQIVAGDLHLRLALPAVAERKLILNSRLGDEGGSGIIWICEAVDLPAVFTPTAC